MGTHNGGADVTDANWKLDRTLALFASFTGSGGGSDPPTGPNDPSREPGESDDVELEDKPISATPRRYKVIFHNDDYTTMEFVIEVLKRFFHKTDTESVHIMLTVHKTGAAVAGVYTRDVAETKSTQVMDYARENGMPLLLTTEPE
jgi:ATP-dependent Clp protease adaptor protein ClpS